MIANLSPSIFCYEDTINTLKYAHRAKQIKTSVTRNVLNVQHHISEYQKVISELRTQISDLKVQIRNEHNSSVLDTELDTPLDPTHGNHSKL